MGVRISVVDGERQAGLESLVSWLSGEPELAGLISVAGRTPRAGELGALGDALVVAVGSGGTLSVLATSLRAWLAQPHRSDVRIRVERRPGESVEITAHRVDGELVEAMVRHALGGDAAED